MTMPYGTNCTVGVPFMQETCNLLKYGSLEPPAYDLGKITAPVVSKVSASHV